MLSVTDTALNLLILQFVLHASGFRLLFLCILAPVHARPKYNILSYAGRICCGLFKTGQNSPYEEIVGVKDHEF